MASGDDAVTSGFVGDVDPAEAWEALTTSPTAMLVDVRTGAEFSFVGVPDLGSLGKDLVLAPWQHFPEMAVDPNCVPTVLSAAASQGARDIYFLCRSGARSLRAAMAAAEAADPARGLRMINVREGFEGDLDEHRRRGRRNGWKARGLPWVQS